MKRINEPQAFVVKHFYPAQEILDLREQIFQSGLTSEASWHPLHDGCPDYHRLHDNYPNAHVKQKMHAFYFHSWYPHNKEKFAYFREIVNIKNRLAGYPDDKFMSNIPSDGIVLRVNVHHYPRGGGYQAEHIDPVGKHAQIQTLVAASQIGVDYRSGGVYARECASAERVFLDPYLQPGDLLVMSPGIQHGVDYIDSEVEYDWQHNTGRWMIMPIIVGSDYPNPEIKKPLQVLA
jgi:hypothetical protein